MNFIQQFLALALAALAFCGLASQSLHAETWPARPISLLVGASPGGNPDDRTRQFLLPNPFYRIP